MATAAIGQGDVYGAASKPFLNDKDRPEESYDGRNVRHLCMFASPDRCKKDLAGHMQCHVSEGWQVAGSHLQVLVIIPVGPEGGVRPLAQGVQLLAMRDVNHFVLRPL